MTPVRVGDQDVRLAAFGKAVAEQFSPQPVQADTGVEDEQLTVDGTDPDTGGIAAASSHSGSRCGDGTSGAPQLNVQTTVLA